MSNPAVSKKDFDILSVEMRRNETIYVITPQSAQPVLLLSIQIKGRPTPETNELAFIPN